MGKHTSTGAESLTGQSDPRFPLGSDGKLSAYLQVFSLTTDPGDDFKVTLQDSDYSLHTIAADDDAILLVTSLLNNHAYGAPNGVGFGPDPRHVTVTIVDTTPSITAGTVRVTGTDAFGDALIENVNIAAGAGAYTTTGRFKTVAAVTTLNDVVTLGGAGDETIKVGVGAVATAYANLTGGAFGTVEIVNDAILLVTNLLNSHTYVANGVGLGGLARRVTVTIVDTTPSIVAGTVRVIGTNLAGIAQQEDVSIAAGAGIYRTVDRFLTVTSVQTIGVTVLGGAGNETIKVGVEGTPYKQHLEITGPIKAFVRAVVSTVSGFDEAVWACAIKRYGVSL